MMRKVFIVVIFSLLSNSLFSLSLDIEMASCFPASKFAYPSSEGFDDIIDINLDTDIKVFSEQLKQDFSVKWCDDNFDKKARGSVANAFSGILSELLPCSDAIFSKPEIISSDKKSFRFRVESTKHVYLVILASGKILSISRV